MDELLILVDENDQQLGKLEKQLVHQRGLLHRAFSVFIFNTAGKLLLQQRADEKYHSGGLWTNTCCSHPRYGEELKDAVRRRLKEEMGLTCNTHDIFHFIYKVQFENGLTEYEYDHIFFGISNEPPVPEKKEVKNWKYQNLHSLRNDIAAYPENYTVWLNLCLQKVIDEFGQYLKKNNHTTQLYVQP